MYSWLQAAQDFREKQDRKNNENLRKSYRIRLGWKKIIRILWNPWVPFHLFVIYSSSSAETKQFNAANAFIDFLLRRPLNSVLFFLIVFFSFFFFFFLWDVSDTTVREGILLLVKHEVENFLSFIVIRRISLNWGTYLYLFLIFHWLLLIPCLLFKFNLKKDTPIWRRAFSFQVQITKEKMFTTTTTARSSWDFIHVPS